MRRPPEPPSLHDRQPLLTGRQRLTPRCPPTQDLPVADRRPNPLLRHAALPALIFVIITLSALGGAFALWRSGEERDRARFEAESRVAGVAIAERMERQITLLRGAAGLFAAASEVTAPGFEAYVERLDLGSRYSGVLGLGYAPRVLGPAERDALVARTQATAASGYAVRPDGDRPLYHPVLLLAPLDRRNRNAVGFDMWADPVRRAAMARARDLGVPAITGRVSLEQDTAIAGQSGFLIFLPVYGGGRVPVTVAGRRQLLQGFVYSPLRARDLFGNVFPPDDLRGVEIAVYEGSASRADLLYATGPLARGVARFYQEDTLSILGRRWVVATASRPGFSEGSQRRQALWTGALGTLTGLLLALAAWSQARAQMAAERARAELRRLNETLEARVAERTSEVTTAYAGLRHEVERRQGAEEQVRQMQKMEAVGQLTGGIAHDFNNMLAVVIGSLDLAKRKAGDPARVARLIDNALDGAARAASLTQRLLAFSRRQPLAPEAINVNRLVGGMSELVRRTIGETIRLETILADGAWGALVDVGQLENAILNLAVNARDAMPDGGRLTIETANRPLDQRYTDANPTVNPGDYVMIAVSDTGTGMPPDVVARAFEPFFTTKDVGKGTGLGLSQVFGFIQQSGGHVEIDSEAGRGTSVRIYLPRHRTPDDRREETTIDPVRACLPGGSAAELILVVEDEQQVRLMSVAALRELGYTVIHAAGGADALRQLEANPGVRLLFTDVVMPEMNGRELADAALARAPGLRLLFTTGYTRDAVVKDGVIDDGVTLMSKPFTFEQLATKVRTVLDAASAPDATEERGDGDGD